MPHFDPKITPWSLDENQFPAGGSLRDKMEFLICYAILAPSSHNTEPWKFRFHDNAVDVLMDHSRWFKVADADQRELHISVGCALENLLIAADHFGLGHSTTLLPDASEPLLAARVTMSDSGEAAAHRNPNLFKMITVRHTNHGSYDGHPIPNDLQQRLVACCVEPEIVVHLTDDRRQQIIVGQVYQRMSLLAALHGIWCQPMSQLVQVPEIKQELMTAALEGGLVPQHPFRMGFAKPETEHTPRRPIDEVLVS